MPSRLPFRATTASGEVIDVTFPLHPNTVSPMRVAQMVSAVLEALDREVGMGPETSNGDVLQGAAMALAIRAAMIQAPKETTDRLARQLVTDALAALDEAERHHPTVGHA